MKINRFLVIGMIVLLAMNVTGLSTFFIMRHKAKVNTVSVNRAITRGEPHRMMQKELDLTPEQMRNIHHNRMLLRENSDSLFKAIDEVKTKIFKEIATENPNEEQIMQWSEEIGQLHGEIGKNTAKHFLKMRENFTPEQTERMMHAFERMGKRRHGAMMHGGECDKGKGMHKRVRPE